MPPFTYHYPRPALTVDAVLLKYTNSILELLLIKRKDEPFKDYWAFPGGFVEENETVEEALGRELAEETGLEASGPVQFFTASAPGRDPRGWTISVVFLDFISDNREAIAGDDAIEARWCRITDLPQLAFDHEDITKRALDYLRDPGFGVKFVRRILPDVFTEEEITTLYKQIYHSENEVDRAIDVMKQLGWIKAAGSSGFFSFCSI